MGNLTTHWEVLGSCNYPKGEMGRAVRCWLPQEKELLSREDFACDRQKEDFGRAGVQVWTRNGVMLVLPPDGSTLLGAEGSAWEHGEPDTLERRYPKGCLKRLLLSQSIHVLLQ